LSRPKPTRVVVPIEEEEEKEEEVNKLRGWKNKNQCFNS
jgi:hypothetical protein